MRLTNQLSVQSWLVPKIAPSGSFLVAVKPMASQVLTASANNTITHSLNKKVCGVIIVNEADNMAIVLDTTFDPAAASNTLDIYNTAPVVLTVTVFIFYEL